MRKLILGSMILALAACGDGSGGGGSVPIVSGPAPSPTPSPSPSPSSTSTPTPYSTYAQLTGNQSFKTGCIGARNDYNPPATQPIVPFGRGLTLDYAAATQTYTLTPDPNDTGIFGSQPRNYGPADRDPNAPATSTVFTRTTGGFVERLAIGSNSANGGSPDYVRGFSLRVPLFGTPSTNLPAANYFCVFGVPTRLDDLPVSNPGYTRGGVNGVATDYKAGAPVTYAVGQSQVSFSADFATGKVTTTIRMLGAASTSSGTSTTTVDLGTYTGTGTIDSRGYFTGQLTSTDRQIREATFGGWFFGPQASEAAFSLGFNALEQTTGQNIVFQGNVLALR